MQKNTYLFLYIPEQIITGVKGLEKLPSEMHLVATTDVKFDWLLREVAMVFNRAEQTQTQHEQRKLIITTASTEGYAKEIAQTKI
jgi:hypothetical protein